MELEGLELADFTPTIEIGSVMPKMSHKELQKLFDEALDAQPTPSPTTKQLLEKSKSV